jgi:hypothetical protein
MSPCLRCSGRGCAACRWTGTVKARLRRLGCLLCLRGICAVHAPAEAERARERLTREPLCLVPGDPGWEDPSKCDNSSKS